jgi:TonB family protein
MIVVYKKFFNKMILGAILILITNLILSTSICFSQEDKPSTDNIASETKKVITAPEFPGGKNELAKWLAKNLKYPKEAKKSGTQGIVKVEFKIDKTGKISDAKIIEGLHPLCDDEVLRLVNSMPNWIPGDLNGKKVDVLYILPIRFFMK